MIEATLKRRFINSSSWTLIDYGSSQIIRFASNLIITRLLLPEAFGLMQLVNIFLYGLEMFSDLGVNVNIIQHKRGNELSFLRTAWTLQIIRSSILWLLSILLAWPFAKLYDNSQLILLIPITCFGSLFAGFISTNFYTYHKNMQMGIVSCINIVTNLLGVIAMISCAIVWKNVWALVAAPIVSHSTKLLASHMLPGDKMTLEWNLEIVKELVHFGKWIFFNSIIGFLIMNLDKLVLGLFLTKEELGCYGISAMLGMAIIQILYKIGHSTLLPLYAHLDQNENRNEMRRKVMKVRFVLLLCSLPPLIILIFWAPQITAFLYPANYSQTGVMLQIVAVGAAVTAITTSMGPMFLAFGDSKKMTILMISKITIQLIMMLSGYHLFGKMGIIGSIALSEFAAYPLTAYFIHKYDMWMPKLDLPAFMLIIAAVYCTWGFH
jgi:O-antigen/teichoic acid export membrane protein